MCNPAIFMVASTVLTAAGGYQQAQAQKAEARYDAAVAQNNAKVADNQANTELQIGNIEEEQQRRKVRQMLGAQRVALAANNVELSSGSALDLQTETAGFGEEDALTIRANAARRAWGYQVDAGNSRAAAEGAKARGNNQATATYLGTATKLAGQGYDYYKNKR